MAWAILMAGGSCPQLPVKDEEFLKAVAGADKALVNSDTYKIIRKKGGDIVIYTTQNEDIPVDLEGGKYSIRLINPESGNISIYQKSLSGIKTYTLRNTLGKTGIYWFHKD